jgi:hypothetical protein
MFGVSYETRMTPSGWSSCSLPLGPANQLCWLFRLGVLQSPRLSISVSTRDPVFHSNSKRSDKICLVSVSLKLVACNRYLFRDRLFSRQEYVCNFFCETMHVYNFSFSFNYACTRKKKYPQKNYACLSYGSNLFFPNGQPLFITA